MGNGEEGLLGIHDGSGFIADDFDTFIPPEFSPYSWPEWEVPKSFFEPLPDAMLDAFEGDATQVDTIVNESNR